MAFAMSRAESTVSQRPRSTVDTCFLTLSAQRFFAVGLLAASPAKDVDGVDTRFTSRPTVLASLATALNLGAGCGV
eukprot:4004846-Pleurochrysis_carterae.AAC.1